METIIDIKKVIITILLVLLTAGSVGGGVWYAMDQNQKKVQANNDMIISNLQKQTAGTNKATTTNSSSSTPTVATSSTIYTNEKGLYSFNLPKNMIVFEGIYGCEGRCAQTVGIVNKQTDIKYEDLFITISYVMYPQGTSLGEILNNDQNYKNGAVTNVKDFIIGGVTGKSYSSPGMGGDAKTYKFMKDSIAYSINVSEFSRVRQDEALQDILSTFKFN